MTHYERMQIGSMLHPPGGPVRAGAGVFLCADGGAALELYDRAVGPALRANDLNRVDVVRVFDSDSALVDVSRWLHEAEVIVAELSAPSAHLMYVLGLAHGLGRCPLMLVDRRTELPFNLAGLRHVELTRGAAGLMKLRGDLMRALRVFLAAARAGRDG